MDFKKLFGALPGNVALIRADAPHYTLLAASVNIASATGIFPYALMDISVFESISPGQGKELPSEKAILKASFDHVIAQNEQHEISFHVGGLYNDQGELTDHGWNIINKPLPGEDGNVQYILLTALEITGKEISKQKATEARLMEQAHKLFMQAPVAIHIFRGPDLVVELANQPTIDLWGKGTGVIGKKAIDILPEIERQGYIDLLNRVRKSGESYSSYETPVMLERKGKEMLTYLNFVLQPFYDTDESLPGGVVVFCSEVTGEVSAKKELAKKEQSLALAIEIGELGAFNIDLTTNVASYSTRVKDWFGLKDHTGELDQILHQVYPADQPFVREALANSVTGKNNGRHDFIYRVNGLPAGELIYLRSIGQVQLDKGKPVAISGIIQDVTQQVLVTKNIEESEERFRTMAEATEILIAVADKNSNITYFNQAWIELTGKPMNDLLNYGWSELIHPDDRQTFLQIYLEAFEKRESFSGEFRILNKQGEYRWLLAKVPVRFRPDGSFAGYISSCVDITDRKLAEEALRQSDAQLRSLIASAPVAIGLFRGRNLLIDMANQTFFDIVGKGDQVIGKPLAEVMPELVEQPYLQILDDVYTTGIMYQTIGTPVNIVQQGVMKYGFYDFSYTPLFDDSGKVYAILDVAVDVTEQVHAKKALEDSEQNLRNTILQAPVAMCIFNGPTFVVDIANHRMLDFWGKTSSEILGKAIFEGLPESRNQGFEELLQQVYSTGEAYSAYEVQVRLPRNETLKTVYVNFVYEAIRDTDGKVNRIMAVAVEVTDQVDARKRVEASEQQVRSLVESAPFPIGVYIGREMRIAMVNQSIIDTWGKGSNLVGKLYAEVLPELDNQEIYEQLDAVYTTGIPHHAKNQRVDLVVNGQLRPFYFNYSFTPLFDLDGNVYGVMNTAADVTDLNIAKQKVEASERDFRNLVMHAPVGICIVYGLQPMVELVNDSFLEIAGKKRDSFETNSFWEVIPEAALLYEPILATVFNTGVSYKGREHKVMLIRNEIEETVYVNFVFDPITDADGKVSKIMILVIEVTSQVLARHKIEELVEQRTMELAAANKSLQQNNEELGQFAYIASHDLQEPLRKVSTFTDMLKNSLGKLDEQSEKYLQRITASTARMSQLIQDVLNFSQLSKGREIFQSVDLNAIMHIIISDFELLIEQKGASIKFEQLPTIQAVPLQMQQLFSNLVSNALKFSKKDVPPFIHISASRLTGKEVNHRQSLLTGTVYYNIEIKDNGIGFDQEYADRIFNIFQRLHTKNDYAGTGIGLALCKKIIQNHHGEIAAISGTENGSTFFILLPEKQEKRGEGSQSI